MASRRVALNDNASLIGTFSILFIFHYHHYNYIKMRIAKSLLSNLFVFSVGPVLLVEVILTKF